MQKLSDLPECIIPFQRAILNDHNDTKAEEQYRCISSKKIPFYISSEKLKEAYSSRFNTTTEEGSLPIANLIPCTQSCLHCNAEVSLKYERRAQIILPNEILNSKGMRLVSHCNYNYCYFAVYSKQCSCCQKKEYFDGQQLGLINMGKFCVSYEVVRGFMNQFLLGR